MVYHHKVKYFMFIMAYILCINIIIWHFCNICQNLISSWNISVIVGWFLTFYEEPPDFGLKNELGQFQFQAEFCSQNGDHP